MLALLVGMAMTAGCDEKCGGSHGCTAANPPSTTILSDAIPPELAEISSESPCHASFVAGDGGRAISVEVVPRPDQTTTCLLQGRTADGRDVTGTITFEIPNMCCPETFQATGARFTISDAGAGAP